jgi:cytochrome bd-type quinol oxidase subunit 2
MSEPQTSEAPAPARRSGPGRILITVYAVFAVAATSRAGLQIATRFSQAPVAYLLSAFAAVVYILATVMLSRSGRLSHRIAVISCSVELVGVLAVGTFSVFDRSAFPDATVWSGYGVGYGFVPLILPVLGLLWLRRTARDIR